MFYDFWWIANDILNKVESAVLSLFNDLRLLPLVSVKGQLFTEIISENSNHGVARSSLPASSSLKRHDILVTHKMVRDVITAHNSS